MPGMDATSEAQKIAKEHGLTIRRMMGHKVRIIGSDGTWMTRRAVQDEVPELDQLLKDPEVRNRLYVNAAPLSFQERMGDLYQQSAMPGWAKSFTEGMTKKPGTAIGGTAALMAGDLLDPDLSIPGQMALGVLGSFGGAKAAPHVESEMGFAPQEEPSDQAVEEGMEMGGINGLLGMGMRAPEAIRSAMLRPKVQAGADNIEFGNTLAAILDNPEVAQRVKSGESIYDVMQDPMLRRHASAHYSDSITALRNELEDKIQSGAAKQMEAISAHAKEKWGVNFLGRDFGASKELAADPEFIKAYGQFKQARKAYDMAVKESFKTGDDFQDLANYRAGEASKLRYDEKTGGLMKGSKQFENVRSAQDAETQLKTLLDKADPTKGLSKSYDSVNQGYGKYKVVQKVFSDPRVFNPRTGEINTDLIATKLRQMKSNYSARMGSDDYEAFLDTARRHAPVGAGQGGDLPGLLERGGTAPVSGRGHMGGMSMFAHLPAITRTKPLASKLIGDLAPIPAHGIPSLITKGLATRGAKALTEPATASVVELLNQSKEDNQ